MSRKFIPNGDLDFATRAESFARTLLCEPERFDVPRAEAEELDAAGKRDPAAHQAARSGGRSMAATREKEDARGQAEQIMRRLGHLVRLNERLDAASKILRGIHQRTARPKMTPCPPEPPRLLFVRALHESGASPLHELSFRSIGFNHARPEGAVRLALFVDLIPPEEAFPTHPGANQGGRPWYLRSYTRSTIVLAPPMPRVPMRILYWGRWADSAGGVGPFSATCAGWIEGGSHHHLPGAPAMQSGKAPTPLLGPPVLPDHREERYSVAVLEVHCRSFLPGNTPASEPREMRQLEGPASEEAA